MKNDLQARTVKAREKYEKARRLLANLEYEHKRTLVIPKHKKLLGTYWKYKNCYSCPNNESDYWFLFRRVESISGYELLCSEFQVDKYGKLEIELSHRTITNDGEMGSNWIKITHKEWKKEVRKIKKYFNSIENWDPGSI